MNKKNLMAYAFVLMSAAHLAHGSEGAPGSPADKDVPAETGGRLQCCKHFVAKWVPAAVGSLVAYKVLENNTGGLVEKTVSGTVGMVKTGATTFRYVCFHGTRTKFLVFRIFWPS